MFTESHTTAPADNGTYHYWEVRTGQGALSLSLLHSRAAGFSSLAAMNPRLARGVSATESGHWVFDVIQLHEDREVPDRWACQRHHRCDVNAVGGHLAEPVWERLRVHGVDDRAVFDELQALAVRVFEVAS
jgi:hypothetical protein